MCFLRTKQKVLKQYHVEPSPSSKVVINGEFDHLEPQEICKRSNTAPIVPVPIPEGNMIRLRGDDYTKSLRRLTSIHCQSQITFLQPYQGESGFVKYM